MTSQRLDGNAIAAAIQAEVAADIKHLHQQGVRPGLTVIMVGHHAASEIYVRNKVKTSAELGMNSELLTPPATVTTEEMLNLVSQLNAREEVDGILIQTPLPAHV
ncbi:MAG: tetrahydrofolate dehydrogenase/cyclohydrolase catalytic domain-containing protein, partial [Acidobacteriaceae bacterium]